MSLAQAMRASSCCRSSVKFKLQLSQRRPANWIGARSAATSYLVDLPAFAVLASQVLVGVCDIGDASRARIPRQPPSGAQRDRVEIDGLRNGTGIIEGAGRMLAALAAFGPLLESGRQL